MAPQLAEDRRHRERREGDAAIGVIAASGLDETDVRDLLEVFALLAAANIPLGETAREATMLEYKRVGARSGSGF
jgi:hypothetical protein